MIEKEFNDRIYTKSTAKREKYTILAHPINQGENSLIL